VVSAPEGETQPEFDLSWSTERMDARAPSDAVHIVASGGSSVDLSRCSRQQSIERGRRKSKFAKLNTL
jgi:hypothetical protein